MDPWEKRTSRTTGKTYWYNPLTKKSQWNDPTKQTVKKKKKDPTKQNIEKRPASPPYPPHKDVQFDTPLIDGHSDNVMVDVVAATQAYLQGRVVEFKCGVGHAFPTLVPTHCSDYKGLEENETGIHQSITRCSKHIDPARHRVTFDLCKTLLDTTGDRSYDVALCLKMGLFAKTKKAFQAFLDTVHSFLKPGGVLICAFPVNVPAHIHASHPMVRPAKRYKGNSRFGDPFHFCMDGFVKDHEEYMVLPDEITKKKKRFALKQCSTIDGILGVHVYQT